MSELLDMGKYGAYVWPAYALFVATLVWDAASPWLRQRRLLRTLSLRQRREAARQAAEGNRP